MKRRKNNEKIILKVGALLINWTVQRGKKNKCKKERIK